MKNPLLMLFLLILSSIAYAQMHYITASDLDDECANAWSATEKKHGQTVYKKSSDAIEAGYCMGYVQGIIEGMDGFQTVNEQGKLVKYNIRLALIKSPFDVITATRTYLAGHALDKGKPAWQIVENTLWSNDLIAAADQNTASPSTASGHISDRCKTGAKNVLSQLSDESGRNNLSTSTLVQLWKETAQCWVDMDDGKTVPEEVLLVTRAQAAVGTIVATRELEFIKKENTVQQFMNTSPGVLATGPN
jgi:hypothetical protein